MSIHALQRIGDVERITETRLKLRRVSTEGVGYLPFAPIQESEKKHSQHNINSGTSRNINTGTVSSVLVQDWCISKTVCKSGLIPFIYLRFSYGAGLPSMP